MTKPLNRTYILTFAILVLIAVFTFAILPEKSESPSIDTTGKARPTNAALMSVEEGIIGTWKSVDDEAYTVTYNKDRTVIEIYDYSTANPPEAPFSTSGTWQVVSDNDVLTLITEIDGEVYVHEVVSFEDDDMTLRARDTVSDLHFIRTK